MLISGFFFYLRLSETISLGAQNYCFDEDKGLFVMHFQSSAFNRSQHQTCDAEVKGEQRPLLFSALNADSGKGTTGNSGQNQATKSVYPSEEEARKACCECNSCSFCDTSSCGAGGGGGAGAGGNTSPLSTAIQSMTGNPPSPHSFGVKPVTSFTVLNEDCISPSPGSSLSAMGPLPGGEEDEEEEGYEAEHSRKRYLNNKCTPALYFVMISGGFCVALVTALQHKLGISVQFPNIFYLAMPLATLVPLGVSVINNLFRVGISMQQTRRTRTNNSWKKSSTRSYNTRATSFPGLHHRIASGWGVYISIAGLLLLTAGFVALVLYLRTPPPPPFYQRPIPIACMTALAGLLGYIYLTQVKPADKKHQARSHSS